MAVASKLERRRLAASSVDGDVWFWLASALPILLVSGSISHAQDPIAANRAAPLAQTAYLKASNAGAGDQFGTGGTLLGNAVALSAEGNTLAVGAPFESSSATGINGIEDDDSAYGAGAVYIFTRGAGGWTQEAYVKASNTGLTDYFGYAVALSADGDTLAVSAYFEASGASGIDADQDDDSLPQAGAVYVFVRDGGVWTQEAYVKASNTQAGGFENELEGGDQFGFALALSGDGDTLAVSAIDEDGGSPGINGNEADNSLRSAGAVYLFRRSDDVWSQQAYVKPTNPGAGDYFGYAVALTADGDTLAVGAYDEDGSLAANNDRQNDDVFGTGAVYIFDHADSQWRQTAYLKAANAEASDSLGVSVAISADGSTLAATALDEDGASTGINSAPEPDRRADTSTGAVYVFVNDGRAWSQQAYIKASNTGAYDQFGARLDLSGDGNTLAVGTQLEDSAARGIDGLQKDDRAQEAGAVYLFGRNGAVWGQDAYIKASNAEAFDEFGGAVALNHDGSILAVGARGEDSAATGRDGDETDNSLFDSGAVYLFTR